jgi:hypothetical protein
MDMTFCLLPPVQVSSSSKGEELRRAFETAEYQGRQGRATNSLVQAEPEQSKGSGGGGGTTV